MAGGLLDPNYSPDPLAMGLLQGGAALLTPRLLGGGLMAGANAFTQGATQAQLLRQQMLRDAQRQKLLDSQIAENDAQIAERKRLSAAAEQRAAGQDEFWRMFGGGGNAAVVAQTGGLAPTNANAALRNQPMQITPEVVAEAARRGIPLEQLKTVSESRNWGRDKVARVEEVAGPDGSPMLQPLDDFGRPVGSPMPKPVKFEQYDTGGALGFRNPYMPSGPIAKTQTPDGKASNAVAWANNAISRANLDLSRQRFAADQEAGKRPQTITTNEGVFVVTPGQAGGMPTFTPASGPDGKPLVKPKDPTEGERNAAGYVGRMIEAEKRLNAVGDKGTPTLFREMAAGLPGTGGKWGPYVRTENQQLYRQAQEDWVRAKLRKESGASIPTDEMDREIQTYFPQPGEPPSVVEYKRQAREMAVSALRTSAGRADIPSRNAGAPQADPLGIR